MVRKSAILSHMHPFYETKQCIISKDVLFLTFMQFSPEYRLLVFLDGKVQCQKLEEEKKRYKENLAFVSRCNPD